MLRIYTFLFFLCLCFSSFAQKRVLIEKFTTANCGSCPNASLIIKGFQDEHPGTIWVSHHKPTTWMDYPLQNDQSNLLWADLNILGQPWAMIDRTFANNRLVHSTSSWANLVDQQADQSYYANLAVEEIDYDIINRTFSFDLNINFDAIPPSGTFRLTAIVVEDSIVGPSQNNYFNEVEGHPLQGLGHPIPNYIHNNVARTILEDHWGTADVVPNDPQLGITYSHSYSYTVPEEYDPAQIKIVGVLAYFDENDSNSRQVLNATETRLSDEVAVTTSTANQLLATSQIKAFPNPAKGSLQIQFEQLPEQVLLLNNQGQIVRSLPTNLSNTVSVSSLAPGLYILKAQFENGVGTKKIVISR